MAGFRDTIDGLGDRLASFSFNQKVLLGALGAAALLSVVIFSFWLQSEEDAVLFTNLSPEDAAAALDELAKLDVTAELANGGSTVMVPEADVHRLRVELAAKGIPSSGVVGFEIFDGKQYGLTEFLQNVNFKRALEGELTKTIASLNGIESARVHLVMPKPSIFKKLAAEPTASVVVAMGRNARLAESQIIGIQSLVAGSVEGLAAPDVRVLDQQGRVLSASFQDDEVGRSENQLALKKEVEGYLGQKAQDMLTEVLGPEAAIVRVDATLNFEKIDSEREVFDNQNPTVRSEESETATDTQAGTETESIMTNYEINRTVERVVGETGGINLLSVAVFVDGTYDIPEGATEALYSPRTDDQLNQIERIVATAIGLDLRRGDRVEIVNMQFQTQPMALDATGGFDIEGILQHVPENLGRLILFIVAAGMVLTLKKNLGRMVAVPSGGGGGGGGGTSREDQTEEEEEARNKRLKIELTDEMADDVKEYSMENPEKMAEMLKTWIAQGE